jgi:hypothetical protein
MKPKAIEWAVGFICIAASFVAFTSVHIKGGPVFFRVWHSERRARMVYLIWEDIPRIRL